MEAGGEVHGYLSDAELSRASVARWWRAIPSDLKRISRREFRMMAEFMQRSIKAQEDAIEAAKAGLPPPSHSTRGRPAPGDRIVEQGKRDERW